MLCFSQILSVLLMIYWCSIVFVSYSFFSFYDVTVVIYVFYLRINREDEKCLYRNRVTKSQILRIVSMLIFNIFHKDLYYLPKRICFTVAATYFEPFGANTSFYFSRFRCSVSNNSESRKTLKYMRAWVRNGLIQFQPMFNFYTLRKHRKIGGFLMFSGVNGTLIN